MTTDINKVINDLGHSSLNGFQEIKYKSTNDKEDQVYSYKNIIDENNYIEIIIKSPGQAKLIMANPPTIFANIYIYLYGERIKYTTEFSVELYSEFKQYEHLKEVKGFRAYYNEFLKNVRLFNGEA